jgi:hypothetical protein
MDAVKTAENALRQQEKQIRFKIKPFRVADLVQKFEQNQFYIPDYQREDVKNAMFDRMNISNSLKFMELRRVTYAGFFNNLVRFCGDVLKNDYQSKNDYKCNYYVFTGCAKTVDELLMNYGIEATKVAMLKQETERKAVQNIVTWCNDLAHGKYSFAEFGRDKLRYNTSKKDKHRDRMNDILFLKESCFIFLEIFLGNIEFYIEQSLYKIK